MMAQPTTGRPLERRAIFILLAVVVTAALVGASMFVWPDSRPIGVAIFAAAAAVPVIRAHRAPRPRSGTGEPPAAAPRRDHRSIAPRHLDLSHEAPTSRSYVEIVPAGSFTLTPRSNELGRQLRTLGLLSLISAYTVVVCLLATHLREAAPWMLAITVTTVAGFSIIATLTRNAHPPRGSAPGPADSSAEQHRSSNTQLRIEPNGRIESRAGNRRSE
ncbi:hypothetical protein [Paractinoplanes brasiliensis]|nr:hypothetical protein [Actinoplanes brasiliensis]